MALNARVTGSVERTAAPREPCATMGITRFASAIAKNAESEVRFTIVWRAWVMVATWSESGPNMT